jgi:hypothetical protein
VPAGHGELLTEPPVELWPEMAAHTQAVVADWEGTVSGVHVHELRDAARADILAEAASYTAELGLPVEHQGGPVIVTGHQPELFHPGVWAKYFLLDKVSAQTGGVGIDLVVDTDDVGSLAFSAPCLQPELQVCRHYLALGEQGRCYACLPAPSERDVDVFCSAGREALETLPAPAIGRHFDRYCECLSDAAMRAGDMAGAIVLSRRLYEAPSSTGYLEMKATRLSRTRSFGRFAVHIIQDAEGFARAYNDALAGFRAATGSRSAAQPFPDLSVESDLVELPFWAVGGERTPMFARRVAGGVEVFAGSEPLGVLPPDADAAIDALRDTGVVVAPRAVTLTLFTRMLVADLFIHGVGGARYDAVTDAIAERYFGLELPPYVATSLTMYLPLGVPMVSEGDLSAAREELHRLTHNPDAFLGQVEFDSDDERQRALELADRKRELVEAIAQPDADKKRLGREIREVNQEIGSLLEPLEIRLRDRLEEAEREHAAAGVLTDRSYPFCLWSPLEVQDKTT